MPDKTIKTKHHRRADQYNDPHHNYRKYWEGREYEHAAEEIAIQRLLRGKHFRNAVDVGGGFGRLCLLLENYSDKEIAFVNHNPKTVIRQFQHAGLQVERVLSVSNLRSTTLKKHVPMSAMLTVEKFLQAAFAGIYFGPSIFFLVKKSSH
jgi:hypothetical protein